MRGVVKGIIEGLNEYVIQVDGFKAKRGDVVEIDLPKEKRSKDANAWYWKFNGLLAQAMNTSGEAIYKHQIRDMSVYNCVLIETEAVDRFVERWCSKHLGRFVETRQSQQEGKTIVLAYYGSSDFDRYEMYKLIENLKEDLRLYNINYDQDEIDRLVSEWQKS